MKKVAFLGNWVTFSYNQHIRLLGFNIVVSHSHTSIIIMIWEDKRKWSKHAQWFNTEAMDHIQKNDSK